MPSRFGHGDRLPHAAHNGARRAKTFGLWSCFMPRLGCSVSVAHSLHDCIEAPVRVVARGCWVRRRASLANRSTLFIGCHAMAVPNNTKEPLAS
jgi:hypothetical protein